MAIRGDLLDLKLLLGEFLSQLQTLLVPHPLQVLHLGLCYPALPLLLLGSLLVLQRIMYIVCDEDVEWLGRQLHWWHIYVYVPTQTSI